MNLFIPNHSIMNQSLDIFISLYNFQNVKNLKYWLIDITGFEYINSMGGDLKTLQLDLDDNFFLYKHGKNLKDEITILLVERLKLIVIGLFCSIKRPTCSMR